MRENNAIVHKNKTDVAACFYYYIFNIHNKYENMQIKNKENIFNIYIKLFAFKMFRRISYKNDN